MTVLTARYFQEDRKYVHEWITEWDELCQDVTSKW